MTAPQTEPTIQPCDNVYTTVKTQGGGTTDTRVGRATTTPDGSIVITLDAIPVNGRLIIKATSEYGVAVPRKQAPDATHFVEALLIELLAAKDKVVCAEIDAANCRTDRDWKAAREAREAYETTREAVTEGLLALTRR